MASIPNASVHTQAWNKVYSVIGTVSDPGGKSKFIYSAFPDEQVEDKNSYPLIVISPVSIKYDPVTFINVKKGPLSVDIDIYSTSASQLDTLSDSITNAMEDGDAGFTASGITGIRITGVSFNEASRNALRIHNKTISYDFDYGWY